MTTVRTVLPQPAFSYYFISFTEILTYIYPCFKILKYSLNLNLYFF